MGELFSTSRAAQTDVKSTNKTFAAQAPAVNATKAPDEGDHGRRTLWPHTASAFSLQRLDNLLKLPLADRRMRRRTHKSHGLLRRASEKAFLELVSEKQFQQTGDINLSDYKFPFENAVFEGGGVKGIAYVGAVKCLEEAGIKLKRFAGSSIGATMAGLLAVGYTSDELSVLYQQELSMFIRDSKCELLCFLPRLIRNFGMNPGTKFIDWYGKCLAVKTNDPDITFYQIFEQFGTELCVVVLNMNTGREEYFHPKTTPTFPVRLAVRMAISLPGLLQPVERRWQSDQVDMYIDGGIICNFPIHVFDGWWLSMKPGAYLFNQVCSEKKLNKLMERNHRFKEHNPLTLGFKFTNSTYFFNDTIIPSSTDASDRQPLKHMIRPDTRLSRKKLKDVISHEFQSARQSRKLDELREFFQAVKECSNPNGMIHKAQLETSLDHLYNKKNLDGEDDSKPESKVKHFTEMINNCTSVLESIRCIPADSDGYIKSNELDMCLIRNGVDIHRILETCMTQRGSFKGVTSYANKLQLNLVSAARRSYVKPEDWDRTVDINTDYIHYTDFDLSTADKEFLMQQGYKSARAFLQHWAYQHKASDQYCTTLTPSSGLDLSLGGVALEVEPTTL